MTHPPAHQQQGVSGYSLTVQPRDRVQFNPSSKSIPFDLLRVAPKLVTEPELSPTQGNETTNVLRSLRKL